MDSQGYSHPDFENPEEQYKFEVGRATKAKRAWKDYIKDFVQEQKEVSFEAFCACDIMDVERLQEAKRTMTNVLALEEKVRQDIQTGRLASQSLKEIEDRKDSKENK